MKNIIKESLKEDLGSGDITSDVLFDRDFRVKASLVAKQEAVLCGIEVFKDVFLSLSGNCRFNFKFKDGDFLTEGANLGTVICPVKTMMAAERTALNFLQHLSGIATLARKFVEKAGKLDVYDTRKTHPLLRELEKYAVRTGGGKNHRHGLYDMVLIKDNHIYAYMADKKIDRTAAIFETVLKAKKNIGDRCKVEVEVENCTEAKEAFRAGADIIMFDNADISELKKFQDFLGAERKKVEIEWSGNVTLETIAGIGALSVDRVSVGAVTHSAGSIDFSLYVMWGNNYVYRYALPH